METREKCLPIIFIHIVISNIQFYCKYYLNQSIPDLEITAAIAFIANLQYIEQSEEYSVCIYTDVFSRLSPI